MRKQLIQNNTTYTAPGIQFQSQAETEFTKEFGRLMKEESSNLRIEAAVRSSVSRASYEMSQFTCLRDEDGTIFWLRLLTNKGLSKTPKQDFKDQSLTNDFGPMKRLESSHGFLVIDVRKANEIRFRLITPALFGKTLTTKIAISELDCSEAVRLSA